MPHSYCLGSLQKSPPESPRPIYDFLCPSTCRGFQPRGLTSRAAPPHQWEAGVGGLNTSTSPPLSGKLWGVSYTVSRGGGGPVGFTPAAHSCNLVALQLFVASLLLPPHFPTPHQFFLGITSHVNSLYLNLYPGSASGGSPNQGSW